MPHRGDARAMRPARALVLLLPALLLAGCSAGGSVTNEADHFRYGGATTGKSTTEVYDWPNSGAAAQVSWGGGGSGTLTLTIHDAAGTEVFRRDLGTGGLHERTAAGQPGTWRVTIGFGGYSGGMGLNIDRA